MPNSGEYGQPTVRQTNLKIPVVAGYTTGRLLAQLDVLPAVSTNNNLVTVELHNRAGILGGTTVVQMVAATDISASGARTAIGSAVSLVRGGNRSVTFQLTQPYVEFQCVSGNSELDVQISSQLKFDNIGFAKTETIYPPAIWQANYSGQGVLFSPSISTNVP